jgi:hypothetical protein
MQLPAYQVVCYLPGCEREAEFKIAARWSDGITQELKTYSLACGQCVKRLYADALVRRNACRLSPNETLDNPQVFRLQRGRRDRELETVDLDSPAID